ncbi:hypothetical protein H8959_019029 [Pygathrix nigripes]
MTISVPEARKRCPRREPGPITTTTCRARIHGVRGLQNWGLRNQDPWDKAGKFAPTPIRQRRGDERPPAPDPSAPGGRRGAEPSPQQRRAPVAPDPALVP